MKPTLVVITVVLLQQGLVAGLWAVMAWLRLSRGPAAHWAVAAAGVSAALVLVAQRDALPEWAGYWGSSALVLAGMMGVRRGVALFARRPLADAEQAMVWGLTMVALAVVLSTGPRWLFVSIVSLALCHVLMATAWTVRRHLAGEFGTRVARACAAPFAFIGVVFALRTVLAPALPQSVGTSVHADGAANVVTTMVFLVVGLLLQVGLLALVLARLLLRLRHQSEHDDLTGLLNRRAIEQRLRLEAERLARYGQAYSVLSIDIDHFKAINDRFGHPAGDAVLREVGYLLRQVGRSVDHVARAGGEEFWMLIPNTGAEGAMQVAERLRRAVRELSPPALRGEVALAVSIGVAVAERAGEAPQALMQRLDAALYRAKAGGRNRVEFAPQGDTPAASAATATTSATSATPPRA